MTYFLQEDSTLSPEGSTTSPSTTSWGPHVQVPVPMGDVPHSCHNKWQHTLENNITPSPSHPLFSNDAFIHPIPLVFLSLLGSLAVKCLCTAERGHYLEHLPVGSSVYAWELSPDAFLMILLSSCRFFLSLWAPRTADLGTLQTRAHTQGHLFWVRSSPSFHGVCPFTRNER